MGRADENGADQGARTRAALAVGCSCTPAVLSAYPGSLKTTSYTSLSISISLYPSLRKREFETSLDLASVRFLDSPSLSLYRSLARSPTPTPSFPLSLLSPAHCPLPSFLSRICVVIPPPSLPLCPPLRSPYLSEPPFLPLPLPLFPDCGPASEGPGAEFPLDKLLYCGWAGADLIRPSSTRSRTSNITTTRWSAVPSRPLAPVCEPSADSFCRQNGSGRS